MAVLVAKEHQCVAGLALVHDPSERTGGAAKNAVLLVTLSEDILAAGAANDVMTTIAGDPLRAIVPEPDLPVAPDQVHSGLQTFQDTATASRTTARFVDMTGQRDSQR